MKVYIRKKTGALENFTCNKIISALKLTASRVNEDIDEDELKRIAVAVRDTIYSRAEAEGLTDVPVVDVHRAVLDELLSTNHKEMYSQYLKYRDYKTRFLSSFLSMTSTANEVVFSGDKENAHKDSSIISTKKELLAGTLGKYIMSECELDPVSVQAHNEGFLHIHDMRDRFLFGLNCCLFDMTSVLSGGFTTRGVRIAQPKRIETAGSIVSNIISDASSCQYGGFTVPEIDKVFAPYVKASYAEERAFYSKLGIGEDKIDEIVDQVVWTKLLQTIESLEYELNLVPTANGQTTFVTFTFGLGMTKEERLVSKAILTVRLNKMGENHTTAIFPKLVFLHRNAINGYKNSPNYDIKKLAIKCSMSNLYPDWLSLDAGYLAEVFDRCGKAISPMG